MRWSRGKIVALAVAGAVVVGAWASVGPIVRARVAAEAERRHLDIDVGSVGIGWFTVHLSDVRVRARGVDGVAATLSRVRVELTGGLSVRQVWIDGGNLVLDGSPEVLAERLRGWRERGGTPPDGATSHPVVVHGTDLSLSWMAGAGVLSSVEATGVGFTREGDAFRLDAGSAHVRLQDGSVDVVGGSIELGAAMKLVMARADRAEVAIAFAPEDAVAPTRSTPTVEPSVHAKRGVAATQGPPPSSATPPEAHAPLVRVPSLVAIRDRARAVAREIAARLPEGALVDVDALLFKLSKDAASIATGPGPFKITHREDHVEVQYSTEGTATGTSLSVRADLPIDAGDVSVTLEGGPVSLALLGVKDGTAGLTDIEQGTVAGKGRIVVADAGDRVTFDGEVRLRGIGFYRPKIARDVVHGLELGVTARGMLDDKGSIRVDDLALTMGTIRLRGGGSLVQEPDHVALNFHVDLPAASCQSLFDSVPTALLPTLAGTKFSGTFGASGRLSFDSRKLDDLFFDYDIHDDCKFVEVPPALARDRFKKPFQHRIYLPDGAMTEETTGPGTSKWVSLGGVSPYVLVAVQTTEDGGFYRHHGFSRPAIKSSLIANLKVRKFVRGASTITMQLAKNLFLLREKTLSRKFEEMILTDYLEQVFDKNELMELYLNIIEFGPKVYGIGPAAYFYFGRSASQLTLGESLFLSSMLPAPLKLSGLRSGGQLAPGWQSTIEHLMAIAKKSGLISDEELEEAKAQPVTFQNTGPRPPARRYADRHPDATSTETHADSEWQPTN